MFPVLFTLGSVPVRSYAVFIGLGFLAAGLVRRAELRRLGHTSMPGYAWVPVGALVGAMVGSKLGMLLFEPWGDVAQMLAKMFDGDFTGKTVVGGIGGGYLGVEAAKKIVGIQRSTGDGFAVALPLAQALGRVGCFLNGCCYGAPWRGPWAVPLEGVLRHPAALYEAALDLGLAGALWATRARPRPAGNLFRLWLVGYAAIRFLLEPLRGDTGWRIGPLTAVQVVCVATMLGFGRWILRARPEDP